MTQKWQKWHKNPHGFQEAYVKDCGGGGDCQFLCVSHAIARLITLSVSQLRRLVGEQILALTDEQFTDYMAAYRAEFAQHPNRHRQRSADGAWDPHRCRTKRELKQAVEAPITTGDGFYFQGDQVTLDLMSGVLGVNFVVFSPDDKYVYQTRATQPTERKRRQSDSDEHKNLCTICLLYIASYKHYQLIGFADHSRSIDTDSTDFYALMDNLHFPKELHVFLTQTLPKEIAYNRQQRQQSKNAKVASSTISEVATATTSSRRFFCKRCLKYHHN